MPSTLLDAIRSRSACAGVIGIGYVGLPLLLELVRAGFKTVGIDIDRERIGALRRGSSYVSDVPDAEVQAALATGRMEATADFEALARLDTINICVPTPLLRTGDPDLSCIAAAVDEVAHHLRKGQLIVLESTTWPGAVEEFVRPRLERSSLQAGRDFYLAFSPERVDPGNREWTLRNIPKVVGAVDADSMRMAETFYEQVVDTVVPVSSTRVAEMAKLIENTFRAVNIGLANETRSDVPESRNRCLGGNRSGADQALRVHAVLSRTWTRRPLPAGGSLLSELEGASRRVRESLH